MSIMNENPTDKLIKVKVTISTWFGNVQSKTGQAELATAHNAQRSDVRAGVSLLPKTVQDRLRKHTIAMRTLVKNNSLPFQDGGVRLMDASEYVKINRELQGMEEAYRIFVMDEIIDKYAELKEMARSRLNGLFDEGKFPTETAILGKYSVRKFIEPISTGEGLKITGLSEAEMEEIRSDAQAEYATELVNGQKDLLIDLGKAIENITGKLGSEGARYKGAVKNLVDLTERIEKLNYLGVPEVSAIAQEVREKFGSIEANDLKESRRLQNSVKSDGKNLMEKLGEISF